MAKWNPNSNQHKAKHGGYKKRPTKKEVNALMSFYAGTSDVPVKTRPVKVQEGAQLKINFFEENLEL